MRIKGIRSLHDFAISKYVVKGAMFLEGLSHTSKRHQQRVSTLDYDRIQKTCGDTDVSYQDRIQVFPISSSMDLGVFFIILIVTIKKRTFNHVTSIYYIIFCIK